ncbi:MAG: ribonuclease HI family protein [Pyramidobacter sp.]|nr:ribonuclease HI family protein [Pyramidobacter sp.]
MIRGHFDGASRGNPGQAGAGAVIYDDGQVVWLRAKPLGEKTNNEAEYTALALLLDELERRGARGAEICGDSKLVISQVTGAWKIKEPRLRALAEPLIERIRALGAKCRWVPREQNAEADRMSNWALDNGDYEENAAAASKPAAAAAPAAAQKGPLLIRPAAPGIWLVTDGEETFAVDLVHRRCTCGQEKCAHLELALTEEPFSAAPPARVAPK